MELKSLNVLTENCIDLLEKNQLLDSLIGSEFVRQKLKAVELEKELEENIIKDFSKNLGIKNEESIKDWCIKKRITEEHFRDVALKKAREGKFCKQNFDSQAEAHFLKRKNDLDTVVYSLIQKQNVFQARELYLRIVENESTFEEIAANHTEGPERITLGRIGPAALGSINPAIREVLRNSKVGETQRPVPIDGYHMILRVEFYTQAKLDDGMRGLMREELFSNWINSNVTELRNILLESKKSNTDVTEEL